MRKSWTKLRSAALMNYLSRNTNDLQTAQLKTATRKSVPSLKSLLLNILKCKNMPKDSCVAYAEHAISPWQTKDASRALIVVHIFAHVHQFSELCCLWSKIKLNQIKKYICSVLCVLRPPISCSVEELINLVIYYYLGVTTNVLLRALIVVDVFHVYIVTQNCVVK